VVARPQQRALPVIGFLSSLSANDQYRDAIISFLQGLKETGYVVGQNAAVEYRYAENQLDRLPALAADLVRRRVAVMIDCLIGAVVGGFELAVWLWPLLSKPEPPDPLEYAAREFALDEGA
jgi:putative ABC transport system substrate-binding protein